MIESVAVGHSIGRASEVEDRAELWRVNSEDREAWPDYAFVPGGPWPHPARSGSETHAAPALAEPLPIAGGDWSSSAHYLRGVALFNAGYYWEAHEAWEALWHAEGRRGATADLLKGLIKLAASGVKVRERQPHGVVVHARRAAASFRSSRALGGRRQLGLDLDQCVAVALEIAAHPPSDPGKPEDRVVRVFGFALVPSRS